MDLKSLIGQVVGYEIGGLVVDVTVLDVRRSYGRQELLISPYSGDGRKWVTSGNLNLGLLEKEYMENCNSK